MDLMAARRRLMEMQELPSAYRRVEYLQSTGEQYIDITAEYYQDIVFKLICQSENVNYTSVIFGYGAGGGYWFGTVGGKYGVANTNTFTNILLTDKITAYIKFGNNIIYVNVNQTEISGLQVSQSAPKRLTIFSGQGSSSWYFSKSKIFGLSASGIMNLIPCVRKADSKPGMYDTVSKTFYTNAGTGEFIIPS